MNKQDKLANYKNFLSRSSLTKLKAISENLHKRAVGLRKLSNQAEKEGRKNNFIVTLSEIEQKETWANEFIEKKTPGKLLVEMVTPFSDTESSTLYTKAVANYKDLLETYKSYCGSFKLAVEKSSLSNKSWTIRLCGTENYIEANLQNN